MKHNKLIYIYFKSVLFIIKTFLIFGLLKLLSYSNQLKISSEKDPFEVLGIENINPKKLLEEIDKEDNKKYYNSYTNKNIKLKVIEDLPEFLQNNNLYENEGLEILSKFLIQDDITLKKYGVVYDISGFDGIPIDETRSSKGSENRLIQRSRSTANIFVSLIFL